MAWLRRLVVVTCVTCALLATSMNSSAWFWTQNPTTDHHTSPPANSTDGTAISHNGQGDEYYYVSLSGGADEPSATLISDMGGQWICEWVIEYQVSATIHDGWDICIAGVEAELYYKDGANYVLKNTDAASACAQNPSPTMDSDDGHLYLYAQDFDYQPNQIFKLRARAYHVWYDSNMNRYEYESPWVTVYYKIV